MFRKLKRSAVFCLCSVLFSFVISIGRAAVKARATEIRRDMRYPTADPFAPVDKPKSALNKSGITPPT